VEFKKIKHILVVLQVTTFFLLFPAASIARAEVTNLQFVINEYTTGGLAISVPSSGTFTSMISPEFSTSTSLTLGIVAVTDTRRGSGALTWSTEAQASNLLSLSDTLTASTFSYASGVHIITGGTALVTAQSRTSLNTSLMVENAASILGNHVVTWTPLLTIPVPANQKAGTYLGTIVHSVA
jgi:hypothetical protein